MKQYKTVGSVKTYQVLYLSQFHYNKIALEDTFPQDKPDEECIMELDARIEKMARVQYPELYQQEKSFVSALAASLKNAGNPYPTVTEVENHSPEKFLTGMRPNDEKGRMQSIAYDIQSCKEVKVLESYKLIAKTDAVLKKIYDEKMLQLTKDESIPNKV